MTRRRFRRRRFLIDQLQVHLLAITLLYFLAAVLVFSGVMFGPLILQLRGDTPPSLEQLGAATEFLALHSRVWPALVVTFAVLLLHSVFTSHRIVGPLYRFRVVFGEIERGNLAPWTTLRRRDFLTREASALNSMAFSLRDRIRRVGNGQTMVRQRLAVLEGALEEGRVREARAHVLELDAALNELASQLDQFRIEAPEGEP